jgi:hypothetical protein
MPIERVRVGRGEGVVRVHATLSEGRHRGVELRAVERDGRVQVELVAREPEALSRLQRELPSLRSAIGDGALSVHVVSGEPDAPRDAGPHGDRGRERRMGHDDDPRAGASEASDGRAPGRPSASRAADAGDRGVDADGPWEVL